MNWRKQMWAAGMLLGVLISAAASESPPEPVAPAGMVMIPAGRFTPLFRGEQDPKDFPVQAFYLDVLPVTNGDFLEFVRANPKWRRSAAKRLFTDQNYLKLWTSDLEPGLAAPTNAPVTFVSWFAAKAYASWKGKRLVTTAEWEYVAAASLNRPDGEQDKDFVKQLRMWYSTPSPEVLPRVGQAAGNFYGVKDLHGLIWEWVSDFNTSMVTGDARGDTGLERQLFCGSGAQGTKERDNFPAFMRYGFRSSLKGSYTVHNLGFRCARSLKEEEK
jgi:formylglycine-generating enzyme